MSLGGRLHVSVLLYALTKETVSYARGNTAVFKKVRGGPLSAVIVMTDKLQLC